MPSVADPTVTTVTCRVTDPPLELLTTEKAFRPNPTTVRFARAMRVRPGDTVFDIGCGIGPLAIKAALDGAARVIGVDPVPVHVDLARRNAQRAGVADRATFLKGRFFEPIAADPSLRDLRAHVIVGDVSGIAHAVSIALGWYSSDVPTGGDDGTDQVRQLLRLAGPWLAPGGTLYFPIATDLSDAARIADEAQLRFETVENALEKPYVEFPLSPREVELIAAAYPGGAPAWINVQAGRRPTWRGQILAVRGPRTA